MRSVRRRMNGKGRPPRNRLDRAAVGLACSPRRLPGGCAVALAYERSPNDQGDFVTKRMRLLVMLIALLAVVAAACGTDGDDGSGTDAGSEPSDPASEGGSDGGG